MVSIDEVEVLLYQTVTEDIKGESEEYHGTEYIQEIDMFQTYKLQFPQKVEMLKDTNVFISDNGASVGSTVHMQLLNNNKKTEKGDSTTLPDGTKTATEIITDLR